MAEFRVLVCGGRDYTNKPVIYKTLDALHAIHSITAVIEGGASGADILARDWATDRNIVVREFPAAWAIHGKMAGPIRNAQMLELGKPNHVVAFPGGAGTRNMMLLARLAGVPITMIST